jgi:hypothetical protein
VSFVLLGLLVLVDGLFCGFRAAAGRNPRIHLWGYYRKSILRGGMGSLGVIALFLAVAAAGASFLGEPLWSELEHAAHAMVRIYGIFATTVLAAIALYLTASFDLAVLASVLVLGPFTLIRPWVIGAGALWVAAQAGPGLTALLALAAGAVMARFEQLLSLGRPPWRDALPK